ncbi:hypothetical protein EJB05_15977, partial [Eragrostis curvula]
MDRSKSYAGGGRMQIEPYYGGGVGRMQIEPYYGGGAGAGAARPDFRSYSYSAGSGVGGGMSSSSYSYQYEYSGGSAAGAAPPAEGGGGEVTRSKSSKRRWLELGDPDMERKRRVASYKAYAVEGRVKGSFRKSFKWIKDRYNHLVYGWS